MATNDIGRVTPIWRGFYSAATTYELNDIVIDTAGSVWWHKSEEQTTGVIPEAGEIWDAVIDMSVFSALIQAAITTAQTAVQAAQEAETGVAEDVQRAETAAQSAEASAEAASESAAGVGALAQAAEQAKNAAQTAASQAAASASSAGASATSAGSSAQTAEAAKTAAQTAATQAAGSAETASGAAAVVEQKKAEAIAAIEAKGEEVLESIPEDYTELSGDVGDLKTQLNDIDNVLPKDSGEIEALISGKQAYNTFEAKYAHQGAIGSTIAKVVKNATSTYVFGAVRKGEVYYVNARSTEDALAIYLTDDSGIILDKFASPSGNNYYNNAMYTVPADGIMYLNCVTAGYITDSDSAPYFLKEKVFNYISLTEVPTDIENLKADVEDLQEDVTELQTSANEISDSIQTPHTDVLKIKGGDNTQWVSGYAYTGTVGNTISYGTKNYAMAYYYGEVKKGDVFRITARITGTAYAIFLTDSDDVILDVFTPLTEGSPYYTNLYYEVPENGKMYLNTTGDYISGGSYRLYEVKKMYSVAPDNIDFFLRRKYYLEYANAPTPLMMINYTKTIQSVHPKVLYFENGFGGHKYWMAYTPYPGGSTDYENPCIAYSDDGYNWDNIDGNPIDVPESGYNSDTHLVYNGTSLECWWRLAVNSTSTETIYRKISTDGVTWGTKEEIISITGNLSKLLSPAVIYDQTEQRYRMWVIATGGGHYINYYEGDSNAENWELLDSQALSYQYNNTGYLAWHLDVIIDGGKYIYLVMCKESNDGNSWVLFMVTSDDNETYGTPYCIMDGNSEGWDVQMYRSSIVKVGDVYRIYYSARKSGVYGIGVSESTTLDKFIGKSV